MSHTFITNEDKLLSNVINDILPTTKSASFLIGYFYFSGFGEIYKELADKNIRILVGMEAERAIFNKIKEFEIIGAINNSRGKIKQSYYDSLTELFNKTDYFDTANKQEAFRLFLNKITDGTLAIKKTKHPNHAKIYLFEKKEEHNEGGELPGTVITGSSNLSVSGLTHRNEINVILRDRSTYEVASSIFNELWESAIEIVTENTKDDFFTEVIEKIWIDKIPKPFLLFVRVLIEYFSLKEGAIRLPADITNSKYRDLKYQADAIQRAISILEKHNGVIVADVVGLGKSIIASTIAHNLKFSSIIIAPPHLKDQWDDFRYEFNFNAKVFSSGKIEDALEYQNEIEEKLIIIDEAHTYRNEETERYANLHKLCLGNKVVLLTATPFNNRPQDVFSMVKLFQIPAKSTIQTVDNLSLQFAKLIREYKNIRKAQADKTDPADKTKTRIKELAKEIRDILSPLMIRRSRLDLEAIDEYREDLKAQKIKLNIVEPPELLEYELGDISELYADTLQKISPDDENKEGLTGARYKPTSYLNDPNKFKEKLKKEFGDDHLFISAQRNLAKFMRRLLVRRFESSVKAFSLSLNSMIESSETIKRWYDEIGKVPIYKKGTLPDLDPFYNETNDDTESTFNDQAFEEELRNYKEKGLFIIEKSELDYQFIMDVESDIELLKQIKKLWFPKGKIVTDPKLYHFRKEIQKRIKANPNRKIIVFTEFADTADYLSSKINMDRVFKYSGKDSSKRNKITIKTNFDAGLEKNKQKNDFDILIATDAISEGFNLHRAGIIFNYDIPYNPTRVIQRVGRINRINLKVFDKLYIFNFFPTVTGEDEIRIKQISTLKIDMIHALLGEDTKVLTKEEELESFFKEQYDNEWKSQEEKSWDADYQNILNTLKNSQTELMGEAIQLPHRTRIKRTVKKEKHGVVVFGRKGTDYTFNIGINALESKKLSPQDALKLFKADISEKAEKVSEAFEATYQTIKNNIFRQKSEVPKDKGYVEAVAKLELFKDLVKGHVDYIDDLLRIIKELDALPDFYMKLIRAMDKESAKNDLEDLKDKLPHKYLMKIISKAQKIDEGEESLILAEELI